MTRLAILGVGTYLPDPIRTNDWWPKSIVDAWRARIAMAMERQEQQTDADNMSEGARAVTDAMASMFADPFRGAIERRVLEKDRTASEMETLAARDALARAGVDAKELDFIITQSAVPDNLGTSNVCLVHKALGADRKVFSLSTEGMCQAFLVHLVLAEQMIASGRFKRGLIVQSSALTRIMPTEDQNSAWFGDGASACVVGASDSGAGVLGHAHVTDADTYGAIVASVRDKNWYDEGRVVGYAKNQTAARQQFMEIPDHARDLTARALKDAGVSHGDIKFWGAHQAALWMPDLTRRFAGLENARTLNTFQQTGNLSGANLGMVLKTAQNENMLKSGDLVALFSGAAGMTASVVVLRWGK